LAKIVLHRKQLLNIGIPLWVLVDGRPLGIMNGKGVNITLPAGEHEVAVRMVFQLFKWQFYIGGSRKVAVDEDEVRHLRITDHERIWNILFDIDMVLWIAEFFVTLPHPWDMVYKIVSDGFFAIWLLRIWIIRKRYFQLSPM